MEFHRAGRRSCRFCLPLPTRGLVRVWLGALLAMLTAAPALHGLDPTSLPEQYDVTTWDGEEGLPQSAITALLPGRDGYLWVGTQQGLVRFDGQHFEVFQHRETAGLPHDLITALAEDWQGTLWIGTQDGLSHYAGGRFWAYGDTGGWPREMVRCLTVDSRGELWVGTRNGIFRQQGEHFAPALALVGPESFVNAVLADRAGNLWVGTRGGLLRSRDGVVEQRYDTASGLPDADVRALAEDLSGNLWVGTAAGLAYLRAGDQRLQRPAALPAGTIHALLVDRLETLWISSEAGLVRHTASTTVTLGTAHDPPANLISSLAEDPFGDLWVGTSRGGLSRLRDRQGGLRFSSSAGAATTDPSRAERHHPAPAVQIELLATRERSVPAPAQVELRASERDFEVVYSAPDLADAERLRFRYRLYPYQKEWVDAGSRRVALFTNIPPGRYRFEVRTTHRGDPWSANHPTSHLELTVRTHFMRTPAFALLLIAGLGLALWGGYRLRVRKLMAHAAELETGVAERTAELVRQKDRLSLAHRKLRALDHEKDEIIRLTAHDLRSPLVTLQGFISELRDALRSVEPALLLVVPQLPPPQRQEISRTLQEEIPEALGFIGASVERVTYLVDGMAQFARLNRRALNIEAVDLAQLAEEVVAGLQAEINERQVRVRVGPLPALPTDRVFAYIIFEDLLRYALRAVPQERPGLIELSATGIGRETLFETWHNGMGITREQESKVFRLFNQPTSNTSPSNGGFGLAYVHSLVHRLGGRIWFESEARSGTRFCFTLPHQPPDDPIQDPTTLAESEAP